MKKHGDKLFVPGQLLALRFSSENEIAGFLLVTHQYRGEIIVELKGKNNNNKN